MPDKITVQQAIKLSEQRLADAKIINGFRPDEMNGKLADNAQRLFELAKDSFNPRAILEATKDLNVTEMMQRAKANDHLDLKWRNQQQVDITILYAQDQLSRAKECSRINNDSGHEFIALAAEKLTAAQEMANAGTLQRDSLLLDELMNATARLTCDIALTQNQENRLAATAANPNMTEIMLISTFALYLLASQHKNLQHSYLFGAGRMVVNAGSNLAKGSYAVTNWAAQGFSSFFYKHAFGSPQLKSRFASEASTEAVTSRTMSHTA